MNIILIYQRVNQLMNVGLSDELLNEYLQKVLIILIDLMRHLQGDEFTKGFLQGGIDGINAGHAPIIKMQKVVRH